MMSKANLIDLVLISIMSGVIYWGYTTLKGPIVDDLGIPDVKMHLQMSPEPSQWGFKHCTSTNTDCGRLDEKSN
tara:strand:- start:9 stop:230 length:222 start_codon:yes stop_codon:yes gene_type:complete